MNKKKYEEYNQIEGLKSMWMRVSFLQNSQNPLSEHWRQRSFLQKVQICLGGLARQDLQESSDSVVLADLSCVIVLSFDASSSSLLVS